MLLGVSACFSAREDGAPELPFDPATGRLREDVWERWLAWDPVRMVPELRRCPAGHAGHMDRRRERGTNGSSTWAPRHFATLSAEIGVNDVHFELFDGTHGRIEYRYPLSLAYLAERISIAGS